MKLSTHTKQSFKILKALIHKPLITSVIISFCCIFTSFALKSNQTAPPFELKLEQDNQAQIPDQQKPETLIVIYMAARNDLFPFVFRSIKQLQSLASNQNVKIFVHLDMQKPSQPPVTKRFFIEKNKMLQVGNDMNMDSGKKETLIDAVKTAYERYPADNLMLIIWNHGTGPIEPDIHGGFRSSSYFSFNTEMTKLESSTLEFFDVGLSEYISEYINEVDEYIDEEESKGICFDDSTGNYLTIDQFTDALRFISQDVLHKKIKIVACDACHMSGIDAFSELSPYVDYYVASEEVELGTGYRYDLLLSPLLKGSMKCDKTFACHVVAAYKEAYSKIMPDFTHSTVDLSCINYLTNNLNDVAQLLIKGLTRQKNKSVKEALRLSKHKNYCTRFKETTYIDLGHFYSNLIKNVSKCELISQTSEFKSELTTLLKEGLTYLRQAVIANAVGEKLKKATGIAIYFPEFTIHKSYQKNTFALKNSWLEMLRTYMNAH